MKSLFEDQSHKKYAPLPPIRLGEEPKAEEEVRPVEAIKRTPEDDKETVLFYSRLLEKHFKIYIGSKIKDVMVDNMTFTKYELAVLLDKDEEAIKKLCLAKMTIGGEISNHASLMAKGMDAISNKWDECIEPGAEIIITKENRMMLDKYETLINRADKNKTVTMDVFRSMVENLVAVWFTIIHNNQK